MKDLILLIADQLATFFPNVTIYREDISQGFEEPSFFIRQIQVSGHDELYVHQKRTALFDVLYFPDPNDNEVGVLEQCQRIGSQLLIEFRQLTGISVLYDKEIEIVDNVLHFTFKVIYRVKIEEEEQHMGSLKERGNIKNA